MTEPFRCSAAADERHESLAGTASVADRFLLVEYPVPWPVKAAEVFQDDVRTRLGSAVDAANAKLLLIRRPGQQTGAIRRWAVADPRAGGAHWGSWESPDDLVEAADVLGSAPDGWSAEPIALVCTHARHDACCGLRGRPVASALASTHRDLVWESSHVGGHRLAGNMVFPLDGTYYGRLDADEAADVVESHLDGQVAADHLRGFSWMVPAAQVVAVEVHRRWGPAAADAISAASASPITDHRWRVELAGGGGLPESVTAEVEAQARPDVRLSCHAEPVPTQDFVIVQLDADSQ